MCGIWGCAGKIPDEHQARLRLNTLEHRGPDDWGLWTNDARTVILGSRRLAILDLSPNGHMPMVRDSGSLAITFNGEIYNFRTVRAILEQAGYTFRSNGDTEILLAAYHHWGTACLEYLDGMFALAIFDGREGAEKLFLARDRAGEKPLYYTVSSDGFTFASELKAIMADINFPRCLNYDAFEAFLAMGNVPGELSILQGVKKLLPAHGLTYDLRTRHLKTWQYWAIPDSDPSVDTEEALERLEVLLKRSVAERLVADVPSGVFLSGGIDSSLITAMAAHSSSEPVRTFTVAFSSHTDYDESSRAKLVAQHFSTQHLELPAAEVSVDILPQMAAAYDEPFADSSLIPTYLISKLTREHVTVALSGDGGDELFGGYQAYTRIMRRHRISERFPQMVRLAAAQLSPMIPLGIPARTALSGIRDGLADNMILSARAGLFDCASRRALIKTRKVKAKPETYLHSLWSHKGSPIDQMTRLDFLNYMPDDILVKVDRASMAVSLETRAPWLSRDLIEFAFRDVPPYLKMDANGKRLKILPRMLARKLLPAPIYTGKKQGFAIPLMAWLSQGWMPYFRQVLADASPDLFNLSMIRSLLDAQQQGRDHTYRLFALTMFELWRRHYQVMVA